MSYINLLQVVLADSTGSTADAAGATSEMTLSFLDLAMKGGWIMIPIVILFGIAIYIFIERYIAIKDASKIDPNFMEQIKQYVLEGKINEAKTLAANNKGPVGRMMYTGVSRIGKPLADINVSIENIGKQEVAKLEKSLPMLASVSGGAPMIGFLGTVMGMIRAFYDMSMAGNNIDVSLLSNGIYTAMVTTVAGLIVGITAYFSYNILVAKIDNLVNMLEAKTTEFMDLLNEPAK
jgi:biopolymer transport protein ExbB